MKRLSVFAAIAAVLCPLAAPAAELSHTWVEAGVARQTFDVPSGLGGDIDVDGGYLRGEVELGRNLYGFGSHTRGTYDEFGADLDLSETQLGIGYAHAVGDSTELLGEVGYLGRHGDIPDFDGGRVSAGVRTQFGDRVEGWAKASYTDGDYFDGDVSAQVGALVKLTPTWGVTGEVEAHEDANRYTLGVRASF